LPNSLLKNLASPQSLDEQDVFACVFDVASRKTVVLSTPRDSSAACQAYYAHTHFIFLLRRLFPAFARPFVFFIPPSFLRSCSPYRNIYHAPKRHPHH